jgi:hypothetical protein
MNSSDANSQVSELSDQVPQGGQVVGHRIKLRRTKLTAHKWSLFSGCADPQEDRIIHLGRILRSEPNPPVAMNDVVPLHYGFVYLPTQYVGDSFFRHFQTAELSADREEGVSDGLGG